MHYVTQENVVGVLRDEYSEWINMLTEEESKAIRKYTSNKEYKNKNKFYARLNAMLRGESQQSFETEMLQQYATIISTAIKKHRLQHNIVCYRGTNIDTIANINVGDTFTFDQFISTSVVRTKAFKQKFMYKFYIPAGMYGSYIESISKYPKQYEFLLDKDCNYKLLLKEKNIIVVEGII